MTTFKVIRQYCKYILRNYLFILYLYDSFAVSMARVKKILKSSRLQIYEGCVSGQFLLMIPLMAAHLLRGNSMRL